LFFPAPWRMLDSYISNIYAEITSCQQTSQPLNRVAVPWWSKLVNRKMISLDVWFITGDLNGQRTSCSYKFTLSWVKWFKSVLSVWIVEVSMKPLLVIQFLKECVRGWGGASLMWAASLLLYLSQYVISVMYLCHL
jgi:hypothetical protein